jgi:hypothetical protein
METKSGDLAIALDGVNGKRMDCDACTRSNRKDPHDKFPDIRPGSISKWDSP